MLNGFQREQLVAQRPFFRQQILTADVAGPILSARLQRKVIVSGNLGVENGTMIAVINNPFLILS